MGPLQCFFAYAQDFEKTFEDDDWSRLERYFASDAAYEVRNAPYACRIEGRSEIFRAIRKSIDGFDRKLAKRSIELTDPPKEDGQTATIGWAVTYNNPGAPELKLLGRSVARYEDGLIVELADEYPEGMGAEFVRWIRTHTPDLDASYV